MRVSFVDWEGAVGKERKQGRTNSGALDHVADCESLDCLVLRGTAGAVGAADGLDVAAAFLVASADEVVSLRFCRLLFTMGLL